MSDASAVLSLSDSHFCKRNERKMAIYELNEFYLNFDSANNVNDKMTKQPSCKIYLPLKYFTFKK